jgi:hypothetical protein
LSDRGHWDLLNTIFHIEELQLLHHVLKIARNDFTSRHEKLSERAKKAACKPQVSARHAWALLDQKSVDDIL